MEYKIVPHPVTLQNCNSIVIRLISCQYHQLFLSKQKTGACRALLDPIWTRGDQTRKVLMLLEMIQTWKTCQDFTAVDNGWPKLRRVLTRLCDCKMIPWHRIVRPALDEFHLSTPAWYTRRGQEGLIWEKEVILSFLRTTQTLSEGESFKRLLQP